MKSNKKLFFVLVLGLSASLFSYDSSDDDAVVNSIKAYSDLSKSDVNSYKLLWLGVLGGPAATGATAYGMYKGYQVGASLTPTQEKLNNIFQSQIYSTLFPKPSEETIQNIIQSKWTWVGVGAASVAGVAGVGFAAYKILYPRLVSGILSKINRFLDLCNKLAVSQNHYSNANEFYTALQLEGNTVWLISSPIAQNNGFVNLKQQASIALLLIDIVGDSGTRSAEQHKRLKEMRDRVLWYQNNIAHNLQFIQGAVQQEKQVRAHAQAEYGKQLGIRRTEISIAGQQIKNVTSQWNLLKDIGRTVHKYGPPVVASIASWKAYGALQNWWSPAVQ